MSPERTEADAPAGNRWSHLIEHIHDAVVEFELVGNEPIVRSVNQSFVDVFGYDRGEIRDCSLNEYIVPEWLTGEARSLDDRTADGEINYRRVKRQTADGLREFLYRGIPYRGTETGIDGFAVYTDLTEINRYARQSRVLNRVLRHNLRNQVNLITGNTALLLDTLDDEPSGATGALHTIHRAAHELETLTQEAARIQNLLDSEFDTGSSIDCVPVIRDLVEEYRADHPAAAVTVDLPSSLSVRGDRRLRSALDSLLDNAIVHNPADEPRVRIRAESETPDGWISICVDDDGPEIPETERRVVAGDNSITPLQHGSGLGLWLVKWVVEGFGGELSFETNEMGGNRVRLRLQR